MRPQLPPHPDDDRLLELAYGEVPANEARQLRQHVEGCPRCRGVIDGIAEVRSAFRSVPPGPAPDRGLDSLLAYAEQAAARARSRRGGLRLLGVLSAAAVAAVVWVLLPAGGSRAPALAGAREQEKADRVARLEKRRAPEQPLASRDEEAAGRGGDALVLQRVAPPPPKQNEPVEAQRQLQVPASPPAVAEGHATAAGATATRKSEAPARAVDGKAKEMSGDGAAGGAADLSKNGRANGKLAARSDLDSVFGSTAGQGSVGIRGVLDKGSASAGKKAAVPSPASMPPGPASAARSKAAADAMAAPLAGAIASTERQVAANATAPADKDAPAETKVAAPGAAKPVAQTEALRTAQPPPEQKARLAEIKRLLDTAKGDERKALLLERCQLEAALELRADVVVTCSAVSREFPGTPEAAKASELARGFSVQLPGDSQR